MTLWSPDTCGCSIEYSDDGNFTFLRTHKVCTRHAAVANSATHLANVLAENQNKNKAQAAMAADVPTARTGWAIDQNTGVITIKASSLPSVQSLLNLQAQFPGIQFVLDTTLPTPGPL